MTVQELDGSLRTGGLGKRLFFGVAFPVSWDVGYAGGESALLRIGDDLDGETAHNLS